MLFASFCLQLTWAQVLVLLFQNLSYMPVSIYIPTYAASLGLSSTKGNLALSLFNVATTFSRFAIGFLSDRRSYLTITAVATFVSSLLAFLVWGLAASSLATLLVFAISFALFAGGFSSTWSPAARDLAAPNQQQNTFLFGLFGAVKGVATVLGPLVAAQIYHPIAQKREYG
jgi:MFS family permease